MIGLIKRRQLSKQFIPFRRSCSNWGSWGGISPVWGLSRSPGWSWRSRNGAHMQSTHLRLTLTHFKLTIHRQSVGCAFSLELINAFVEGKISKIIYNPATLLWIVWHTFQGSFAWSIYDPVLPWAGQFSSRNFGGGKSRRQLQLLITGTPRPLLSWFLTFRDNNSTNKNVGLWTCWFFLAFCPLDYTFDMTHSQMLGKFEYTRGPIFKVVLEC